MTWPGWTEGNRASTLGIRGRVWTNRMLPALSTSTAMEKPDRFCWKDRLRSPVIKT